jgi:hypothetical protein
VQAKLVEAATAQAELVMQRDALCNERADLEGK